MGASLIARLSEWEQTYVATEAQTKISSAWDLAPEAKSLVLVTGPRGCGKTALLRASREKMASSSGILLQQASLPSEEFVALHLLRALGVGGRTAGQDWRDLLASAFEEIARAEHAVLVLFDDLDQFVARRDEFKSALRRHIQEARNLVFVATSASQATQSLLTYDEPFYGLFQVLPLGRLGMPQSAEVLQTSFDLPARTAELLASCIQGEPLLLRSVGRVLALAHYKSATVDPSDVLLATSRVLQPSQEGTLGQLPPAARPLLPLLAAEGDRWATSTQLARWTGLKQGAIAALLRRLVEEGTVEKQGSAFALRPLVDFCVWWGRRAETVPQGDPSLVERYLDRYRRPPKILRKRI